MFISFLSLGQGGGNIADEAAKRDFYTASINFSQKDLDSLEHVSKKLKLVGSEGIGKFRNNAVDLMDNNWDLATNFVKENFSHSSIEIIFVPFSTAGGSGSGIAPVLLSMLKETMPDKVFVAMPIIPDKKESYINQKNCLETFEDLSKLNICILPIDNEKGRYMSSKGKSNLYDTINKNVMNKIEKINSYLDKNSKYGVIDKRDIRSIFNTSGIATIGEVDLSSMKNKIELNEESIANKIKESWIKSLFADIELNKIISAGIIFEGQNNLMEYINAEKIFSKFANRMPISLYEGYYTGDKGSVMTILSGLSWCNTRLKEVDAILDRTGSLFNSLKEEEIYSAKTKNLLLNTNVQQKTEKVNDISDLINQFKRKG